MNYDKSNMGKSQTFPPGKIYWKKYWEKINIDTTNKEKLFDRSTKHK